MKRFLSLTQLGFALFIAVNSFTPVAAQNSEAVARPEPLTLEVGQGQIETVSIVLEDAQAVYGIDLRAKFDPAVIEIVDADLTSEGVQMTPGNFPQPDFLVRNVADNEAGGLMYVATQVNPTPPANGSGLVVSIQVRGKVLGQQSGLTIEFLELVDRQGRKLDVEMQAGVIQVGQPKPPTQTPEVSASVKLQPPTLPVDLTPTAVAVEILDQAADSQIQTTSPISNRILQLLAGGGCLGTLALFVVAGWVTLRPRVKPRLKKDKSK